MALFVARGSSEQEQGRILMGVDAQRDNGVVIHAIRTYYPKLSLDFGGEGRGTRLLLAGMLWAQAIEKSLIDGLLAPDKDFIATEEWYAKRGITLNPGCRLFGYVPAVIRACREIINSYS